VLSPLFVKGNAQEFYDFFKFHTLQKHLFSLIFRV